MKKFKSTKKYSFFVIVTILIVSMVSMLVYGELNKEQFKVSIENSFSELKYGEQKEITYEINPNTIKFKDNVEKDVVLVLDTSQTVNEKQGDIEKAANDFVNKFLDSNNYKNFKIGIISYNEKAEVVQNLTTDKNKIKSSIADSYKDAIKDNRGYNNWLNGNHLGTNVGDAFRLAIAMLGNNKEKNKEKSIILMSNGKPNAYTGDFYKEGNENYGSELFRNTSISNESDNAYNLENVNIDYYEKFLYRTIDFNSFNKRGFIVEKLNKNQIPKDILDSYLGYYWSDIISNIKKDIYILYNKPYSINLKFNDEISYYMGGRLGYIYSLYMAKNMKNNINLYPIYFEKRDQKDKDIRENTMKEISKASGNVDGKIYKIQNSKNLEGLSEIFNGIGNEIDTNKTVNDAELTIKIPKELELEKINGEDIDKDKLVDGSYKFKIPKLNYKFDKISGQYKTNALKISIAVKGVNTSGSDKNCTITGDIYSKSIEDGEKTDLPNLNINVKSGFQVEITVKDFIGNIGKKYDSNNIKLEGNSFNFIQDTKRLIGDGNANISVKGMPENKDEEYWIKTWFTKGESKEEIEPKEFKLNNINSDIDLENSHNLTYQSYNVNHLETTGDEDSWNDRNQVFKSKQGDTGFLPANKIAGETGDGVNRIFQYGEPLKLNSKRPVYVYGNSKYCELKKTGTYKEFYDHGKNIKFEVWTYKWKNWFGNIENYEVYKYKEKWLGLNGGKIIYVDNWMWKHKTIFYDEMRVDNINDDNKYPGFSYKEADKYWGYIKPKESGWYLFGTYSDDGSRFSITKDGKTYELSKSEFGLNKSGNNRWHIDEISSNFKVHGSSFYSSFTPIHLDKDKYYPIQLEYFNWGGNGCFKLGYCRIDNYENTQNVLGTLSKVVQNENYKYDKDFKSIFQQNSKHYINDNIINKYLNDIQWIGSSGKNEEAFTLYPSKSNEPADIADEVFEGKSGVKFPKENGIYTIHYEIITRKKGDEKPREGTNGTILQLGEYGKFEVKDLLDTSISVVGSNNQKEIYLNEEAKAVYKMTPNEIKAEDIIRDGRSFPKEIKLTEIKIYGMLPSGMKFDENNNPSINLGTEINGERKFYTDKLTDITYTLENGVYKGSELSKDVNVNIKSNGPFQFKSSENKVGFKLNYEYKITNPMFEEFKGTSVSASEPTKIEKFGILDSSSSDNIKDSREGVQVVNGIPLKMAILADVKSPNSIIDLGFNSQNIKVSKDTEPQFKIKIYNKGNLINSEKEFNIDKLEGNLIEGLNSGIKISGLDVGEKVIVVELIPNNIEINNSALLKTKVENSNDKEHLAKLDYAEMPDVF